MQAHRSMLDAALARDAATAVSVRKNHVLNGLEHTLTAMADSEKMF